MVFNSTFCERRGKKMRDRLLVQSCTTVQGSLWRVALGRRVEKGAISEEQMIVVVFISPLEVKRCTKNPGEILCAQCFPATGNRGGGGGGIQSLKKYMIACCLHFSAKSQGSFKIWVGFCVHSCFPVYLETISKEHTLDCLHFSTQSQKVHP